MVNTIGFRETEKALQLGKLYTVQEALDVKLVDEVVAPESLLQKAEDQMAAWLKIPSKFKILKHLKMVIKAYLKKQICCFCVF
jgi:enoyl-CoA hydratase/carnithine racemase